jgi:hypothetical protein
MVNKHYGITAESEEIEKPEDELEMVDNEDNGD